MAYVIKRTLTTGEVGYWTPQGWWFDRNAATRYEKSEAKEKRDYMRPHMGNVEIEAEG
jgi:hypothetical protein